MDISQAVTLFLRHTASHFAASTVTQYKHQLGVFSLFLAEHHPEATLESVDLLLLEDFFAYLRAERRACSTTLCHYQTTLRAFFDWAVRLARLPSSPLAHMQPFRRRESLPHYLSLPTLVGLLQQMDQQAEARDLGKRDALIVWVLALTGMRRAEACNLDWRDIDFSGQILVVREGKGAKDRAIPLLPVLVERLTRYWEELNKPTFGPVFPSTRGGGKMHPNSLWEVFERHVKSLVPGITPHVLRHTLATLLCQGGAGLRHVQELLGHASPNTTQKYTHLAPKDVREALAALNL